MKKRLISIGFLALLLGAGGLVYWGQRKERLTELYYCGTMEQLIVTPLKPIELILGKTIDPVFSVSLRTSHGCPLCHRHEFRIRPKVYFAQCRRSAGLGDSRPIRRLFFRPCPGGFDRQAQIIRDLYNGQCRHCRINL